MDAVSIYVFYADRLRNAELPLDFHGDHLDFRRDCFLGLQ